MHWQADKFGSYKPVFLVTAGLGALASLLNLPLLYLVAREDREGDIIEQRRSKTARGRDAGRTPHAPDAATADLVGDDRPSSGSERPCHANQLAAPLLGPAQ